MFDQILFFPSNYQTLGDDQFSFYHTLLVHLHAQAHRKVTIILYSMIVLESRLQKIFANIITKGTISTLSHIVFKSFQFQIMHKM